MSYAIPGMYEESSAAETPLQPDLVFVPRSHYQWVPFLLPLLLCGVSWLGDGIPALTDMGFSIFTILCFVFLTTEFIRFPRRFGIGGLVLWGGTLCWFCQDYFTHWFNHNYNDSAITM